MKKRSFVQLKKSMNYEEFNTFCRKITQEYAESEAHFARTYFTEHYNISNDCYYKVLEHAVVTNLVGDIIVSKMMNKAINNQSAHNVSAGGTTRVKYARMYEARCKYIADTFSKEEVKKFALDFANNPDVSKTDIASSYGIVRKVADLLLVKAIEENIVDEPTVCAIEERSIKNANPIKAQMTKEYFVALRKKREANKNVPLGTLPNG